jgi:hypothetical protein
MIKGMTRQERRDSIQEFRNSCSENDPNHTPLISELEPDTRGNRNTKALRAYEAVCAAHHERSRQ